MKDERREKMSTKSGRCPTCGTLNQAPKTFVGMWDGHKSDGTKVGGPIFKIPCSGCGKSLIAFSDILEDVVNWEDEATTVPKNLKLRFS
jgi:hypothetical protein